MDKLKKVLLEIENLKINEDLLLEKLILDLEYLYKKYDKRVNPKYLDKLSLDKISILFYESGINLLLKEGFNEKTF